MIADLGDSAERESAIGQALVTAADGVGTGEVRAVFEKALGLDPAFAEARFFIALAAEQDGDMPKAAALLAETPANAPWRPAVAQHLAAATGMPGLGATPPPAAMASPMPAASGDAAAAIAALPADQRLQAIRGMVDGLAARLAQKGRDIEGLLRLVKAYTFLATPSWCVPPCAMRARGPCVRCPGPRPARCRGARPRTGRLT